MEVVLPVEVESYQWRSTSRTIGGRVIPVEDESHKWRSSRTKGGSLASGGRLIPVGVGEGR